MVYTGRTRKERDNHEQLAQYTHRPSVRGIGRPAPGPYRQAGQGPPGPLRSQCAPRPETGQPSGPGAGSGHRPHDRGAVGRGGAVSGGERRKGLAGRGHYSGHCGGQQRPVHLSGGPGPTGPGGAAEALLPHGSGSAGWPPNPGPGQRPGPRGHHLLRSRGPGPCRRPAPVLQPPANR